MILSAILRRCLALVAELDLPAPCRRDLLAALDQHQVGSINTWQELGLEAGLEREELLGRGVALFFLTSTVNLCDDIMDGDATYVPATDAPLAQLLLHTGFAHGLSRTSVSRAAVARATRLFADVCGSQHTEVNCPPWDEARYREMARRSGGRQVAAYLRIFLDGTPLEAEAEATGDALGTAAFVDADVADDDPRLLAQGPPKAAALCAWAAAVAARVEADSASATCRAMAAQQRARLAAAAAKPHGEPPWA